MAMSHEQQTEYNRLQSLAVAVAAASYDWQGADRDAGWRVAAKFQEEAICLREAATNREEAPV
jgi:hypothetical protein